MEVQPLEKTFDKDKQLFLLKLATQAGTYVKEFVHGDFGRTEPNVSQILDCDVDILALDVEVSREKSREINVFNRLLMTFFKS